VQSLIGQYRQLDQVRMDYGGWDNFVRRHLPDGTSDDAMAEFIEFLEVRHKALAEEFGQEYTEGAALAKARIHQLGASPQVADEIIGGTYGPLQTTSESYGYGAWLSPEHDGISESQAIRFFSIEEALGQVAEGRKLGNAAEAAIGRDEELLRQLKTYVDAELDVLVDNAGTEQAAWVEDSLYPGGDMGFDEADNAIWVRGDGGMNDDFANPWAGDEPNHYWGEKPMAADPRFGMIIIDEHGRPLMRMPTEANGTGGDPFGGVLWTFAKGGPKRGESPYQTAVRETEEETGLVVEGFAQIEQPLKGSTESMNYYYIGRIKPGTTQPSIISGGQLVDQQAGDGMAQFLHADADNAPAFLIDPSSGVIMGKQQTWHDTYTTNYTAITQNYVNNREKMRYPVQVNVGMSGDQILTYGMPAQSKQALADFLQVQKLITGELNQATIQSQRRSVEEKARALDAVLDRFPKPYGSSITSTDVAAHDQAMDMLTRLFEYDKQTYQHLVASWENSGSVQHESVAQALRFVENFSQWNIPTINDMNLRNRIGFLDYLENAHYVSADQTVSGVSLSPVKGKAQGKVAGAGSVFRDVLAPKFMHDVTDTEMSAIAARYLASFDQGVTGVQQWQAFILGPGGHGRFGSGISIAMLNQRNWHHQPFVRGILKDQLTGTLVTRDDDAVNRIYALIAEREKVFAQTPKSEIGRGHLSGTEANLSSVERGGVPQSRHFDFFVDEIRKVWRDENFVFADGSRGVPFNEKEVRRSLEAYIADRRLISKVHDVYRRSLTADGYNATMWYNKTDSVSGAVGQGVTEGFPVATLINPHAVKAMPRSQTKGKLHSHGNVIDDDFVAPDTGGFIRTGEGPAPGGVLNAQKFMNEYVRAVENSPAVRAGGMAADDPLRLAMDAKIESAIRGEKIFVQEAAALRDEVARLKVAKGEAAKHLKDVKISGKQRSAMDTLLASMDKRMNIINVAEGKIARLGTVDQYGQGIPLESLPDEVRNIRLALDALEDADARGFREATSELKAGADAAKYLREVGEYGDDTIYFPLNKEYVNERLLDEGFQQGFSAFGVKSQGPSEIVESMVAVDKFYAQGGFATFLKHYDKVYNLLKGYMIMKPGFHMRNYFSAVFMNYLDGVKMSSYRRFQNAYWNNEYDKAVAMELPKRAENMKKAMKLRGVRSASAEDMDIIRRLDAEGLVGGAQGQIGTEQVMGEERVGGTLAKAFQAINPLSSRNAPLRLSRSAGIGTETYVRGVMAFDSLARGDLASEAFERVMKFHFDYSDLSRFEAQGIKRVVPFYTWTRKNLPLMIEQFGKRPEVFNQYNILKANIEGGSEGLPGADAPVPPWMIRQAGIRLPFKYEGEYMHVLPDLPFKTPLEMLGPLTKPGDTPAQRIEAALSVLTTQLTPFVKTPIEWTTRRNLWKGYNFDGRMGQVPTVYAKVPLLMPLLEQMDMAHKNEAGIWLMRDYDLHSMATMLPTFADARRLFPSEERYQQRILSTWMSFVFGLGLRTNTKAEQQRTKESIMYELRSERSEQRRRARVGLNP
jgi:hypothetical protein